MLFFLIASLLFGMISLGYYVLKFSFAAVTVLFATGVYILFAPLTGIVLYLFVFYVIYKLIFD